MSSPVEHIYPLVRTQKQLDRVLDRDRGSARHRALHAARRRSDRDGWRSNAASSACRACRSSDRCCSCSSPISAPRPSHRVGAQHMLNAEYFKRIDALNYTMLHDDGQHVDELEQADVVLVGVSRTSKTPTSIYLANRGVKTANVPLVPGVPLPPELETAERAAGGRALRQPGAHRADPRRTGCLGSRRTATTINISTRQAVAEEIAYSRAALRQAQLAVDRRDAPLDRGNRRGGDEAAGGTPPAAAADMALWLAPKPLMLASKSAVRRAMLAAAGFRSKSRPADIDERGIEARSNAQEPADVARRAGAARRRMRSRRDMPAAWCSAPTRRWRSASSASPSRPTARLPREQLRALRGKTHRLIRPSRWCATAECCSSTSIPRELTMRHLSDAFIETYLDAVGEGAQASVGGYQLEGAGIQLFERIEGDHFTHSGPAAAAAARVSAQRGRGGGLRPCSSSASPARSPWASRPPRSCSPRRACRCTTPTLRFTGSMRARRSRRSRRRFRERLQDGKVDRDKLAAPWSAMRRP